MTAEDREMTSDDKKQLGAFWPPREKMRDLVRFLNQQGITPAQLATFDWMQDEEQSRAEALADMATPEETIGYSIFTHIHSAYESELDDPEQSCVKQEYDRLLRCVEHYYGEQPDE